MMSEDVIFSEDKLDAKLAGLELRLVDRITSALNAKADASEVAGVRARVHSLESSDAANRALILQFSDQEKRIRGLERFRYAVPSAAVVVALASVITVLIAVLHLFH